MRFSKEQLLQAGICELRKLLFTVEGRDVLAGAEGSRRERPTEYRRYLFIHYGSCRIGSCPICKSAQRDVTSRLEIRSTCLNHACVKSMNVRKMRSTVKDKYGVSNVSKLASVKLKKTETCMANHGVAHPQQSKQVQATTRKNNLRKYGAENVSQVPSIAQTRYDTFMKKFGGNPFANSAIKEKIRQTHLEKRGVAHPTHDANVRTKQQATIRRTYGVDIPYKSAVVRERGRRTAEALYGVAHPMQDPVVAAKARASWRSVDRKKLRAAKEATTMRNYGVAHHMKDPKIAAKISEAWQYIDRERLNSAREATSLAKYGVRHPMQNAKFFADQQKRRFQRTPYLGMHLQGYEPIVAHALVRRGAKVGTTKDLPPLWYACPVSGKQRRYYPDLVATGKKRTVVVEVKSEYTAGINHDTTFAVNRAKFKAAHKAGLDFVLAVAYRDGSVAIVAEPWRLRSGTALRRRLDQNNVAWL